MVAIPSQTGFCGCYLFVAAVPLFNNCVKARIGLGYPTSGDVGYKYIIGSADSHWAQLHN
jgi:hypothetical protein